MTAQFPLIPRVTSSRILQPDTVNFAEDAPLDLTSHTAEVTNLASQSAMGQALVVTSPASLGSFITLDHH